MAKRILMWTIALVILAGSVRAQDTGLPDDSDDILSRPSEHGFRITPGLARILAQQFTKNALIKHYQMDEAKSDEVNELVTRRMMQAAHALDGQGQEFLERLIEEQLVYQKEQGGGGFMPPSFGQEFAKRLVPMMPAIRDVVRGVGQDIRPMLPFKKQLTLARDLMGVNTMLDAFEERMTKWANGEEEALGDPFRTRRPEDKVKLDENGESTALKRSRKTAEEQLEKSRFREWKKYVQQAKQFYQFDDAQAATADSILREYLERAQSIIQDQAWRTRVYQNRVWSTMLLQKPNGRNHPLQAILLNELIETNAPLRELENQLKARIETIPTHAQRKAADDRLNTWLADKGLELEESEEVAQ